MKFSINIEVNLTKEEISFVQKYFVNNTKTHNRFFFSDQIKSNLHKGRTILDNLNKKQILYFDNIGNIHLTIVGNNIIDQLDRDKKINTLLDE